MKASIQVPGASHDFESYGHVLGVDGEEMKLTLTDEARTQTVRVQFSRDELVTLLRTLVSGRVLKPEDIA
ncbi:MAG: hypothetical protein FJX35_15915 [Alphaproteobacteria bacterium]|nr:hypothetical protein [Alphaproteobacteria bacterium]